MTQQNICVDLWQNIMSFSKFSDQITVTKINKDMHDSLKIHNMYDIDDKYRKKLTDDILRQNIYSDVEELNLRSVAGVTDVNHLKNIRLLDISATSPDKDSNQHTIGNEGIKHINPTILNVECNINITNIGHMSKLKMLIATSSRIKYDDIKDLENLKSVDITDTYMVPEDFENMDGVRIIDNSAHESYDVDEYEGIDDFYGF